MSTTTQFIDNISKVNTDFSFTQKFANIVGNDEWFTGYQSFLETGEQPLSAYSQNYSSLYAYLSASIDGNSNSSKAFAPNFYEKLANYISNINDIEYCELKSLRSISQMIGTKNYDYFNYSYPLEIQKLVDIFSVSKDKLFSSVQSISSYISGGQFVQSYSLNPLLTEQSINLLFPSISAYMPSDPSGAYIDDSKYLDMVSASFKETILAKFNNYSNIDISTVDFDIFEEDSTDIKNLKIKYGIQNNVNIKKITNSIINKTDNIENYSNLYRILINRELTNRQSLQIIPDQRSKFDYDKKQELIEYIKFINDITNSYAGNSELQKYSLNENYLILDSSSNPIEFSSSTSAEMINQTAVLLRNICVNTSYLRQDIKSQILKYQLIGCSKLIQVLVSEYLAKHFTTQDYWRIKELSGYCNDMGFNPPIQFGKMPFSTDPELSGILGNIKVIEYVDNTEYMNIVKKGSIEQGTNLRYWEGEELQTAILLSEHTSADIMSFYKNLYNNSLINLDNDSIINLYNSIYSLGATPASVYTPSISYSSQNIDISGPSTISTTNSGFIDYRILYNNQPSAVYLSTSTLSSYIVTNLTNTARVSSTIIIPDSLSSRIVRLSDIHGNGTISISLLSGSCSDVVSGTSTINGVATTTVLTPSDSSINSSSFIVTNLEIPYVEFGEPTSHHVLSGNYVYDLNFYNTDSVASDFSSNYSNYISIKLLNDDFSNTNLNNDPVNSVTIVGNGNNKRQLSLNLKNKNVYLNLSTSGSFATNSIGTNDSSLSAQSEYIAIGNVKPMVVLSNASSVFTSGDDITFSATYIGISPAAMNEIYVTDPVLSANTYSIYDVMLLNESYLNVNRTGNVTYSLAIEDDDINEEKKVIRFSNFYGQGQISFNITEGSALGVGFKTANASNVSELFTVDTISNLLVSTNNTVTTDSTSSEDMSVINDMYRKYSSNEYNPYNYANIKNTVHPSVSYIPFLWNLVSKDEDIVSIKTLNNIIFNTFDNEISELVSDYGRFNLSGITINSWINDHDEYCGYETAYEYSKNIDSFNRFGSFVDVDGPWIPDALSSFVVDPRVKSQLVNIFRFYGTSYLNPPTQFSDPLNVYRHVHEQIIQNGGNYYNQYCEKAKILKQLNCYSSQINDCSGKIIYQFNTDIYGNNWTLFKNSDDFNEPGTIWLRLKNHPYSFPLLDGLVGTNRNRFYPDVTSESDPGYCSQINIAEINRDLRTYSCYDFGIIGNYAWIFTTKQGATSDPNFGDVSIIKLVYKTDQSTGFNNFCGIPGNNNITKLSVSDYEKYVGVFAIENNIVLCTTTPSNGTSTVQNNTGTYNLQLNFRKYTENTNGNSYSIKTINTVVNYPEYITPNHNNFKLTIGKDKLMIAFEFDATDFYSTQNRINVGSLIGNHNLNFSAASGNCLNKFSVNGICTIEFKCYNNSINYTKTSYYLKCSDLTYNLMSITDNATILTIPENTWSNLQIIGEYGNSYLNLNDFKTIKFTLSGSNPTNVYQSQEQPYWANVFKEWQYLSGFSWESDYQILTGFVNPLDTIKFSSTDNYGLNYWIYLQYVGEGCKKFKIKYNHNDSAAPAYVWDHTPDDLSADMVGFPDLSAINEDKVIYDDSVAPYDIKPGLYGLEDYIFF